MPGALPLALFASPGQKALAVGLGLSAAKFLVGLLSLLYIYIAVPLLLKAFAAQPAAAKAKT